MFFFVKIKTCIKKCIFKKKTISRCEIFMKQYNN